MNYLRKLIISIKIYYYFLVDKFTVDSTPDLSITQIEQSRQNVKLIRGVKKLIARLRSMNPEDRTKPENLLSAESYKKSKQEVLEELRVRHKVLSNPILKTEDDLVRKVVKNAPAYALEQEVKEVRKQITATLKASAADPKNVELAQRARSLSMKLKMLRTQIRNIENG